MKARLLPALLAVLCVALPGSSCRRPASPPNIVFILLDAARPDHFSSYGYERKTTPAMDAIAEKGTIFLNNFVPETQTYEVMPLIMFSRHYSKPIFQMDTWWWGSKRESPHTVFLDFDPEQILLPAALSAAGYRTVMFHNHPWFAEETEFASAFDESHLFPTPRESPVDDMMVDAVLDWIRRHREERFFVYYHVMSPHEPYPPKEEDLLFIGPEQAPALEAAREKFQRSGGLSRGWTEEELYYFRVLYDSNLAHSDAAVGRLYYGLAELGLAEDALFIITSDHGELLGQHGRLTHGDFPPWDAAIHVPLIMTWPGRVPAGLRVEGMTESLDIYPTIIDLAGIGLPPGKRLDGVSLKRFLDDPSSGHAAVYIKNSVRTPRYKYMIDRNRFFDLENDPGETFNLAAYVDAEKKREIAAAYERFKSPFRERYLSAVREGAPDYRFYFTINEFDPGPGYRVVRGEQPPQSILEEGLRPGWHLNTAGRRGYLLYSPGDEESPALTLSCHLPDGTYNVSLLFEPGSKASLPPGLSFFAVAGNLRARFDRADGPGAPEAVRAIRSGKLPPAYLDYGRIEVENERFWLEISYPRLESAVPFVIHHILFDPLPEEESRPEALDQEDFEERMESLRSLGYIQ